MNSKYHNKIVYEDNICFKSLLERRRYQELKVQLRAGCIRDLKVHTRWKLVVNGHLIATYEDDFSYYTDTGALVVEDTKGCITRDYRMKKKLMAACHGVEIVEVTSCG